MDIGIGLPNPLKGMPGPALLEAARRAEQRGFSGLVTIDRVAYPSLDSLTTLAAAAGATSTIRLMTNILIAPAYPPVLLAKSVASLDQLSGGRFTLGVGVGGRPDDYALTGRDFSHRGSDLDALLPLLRRLWAGGSVEVDGAAGPQPTPVPVNDQRVPIMLGGTNDRTIERIIRYGDGWTSGGGGPELAAPFYEKVRDAWSAAGRPGQPRLAGLVYFSLGADVADESQAYLRDYYGFLGPIADMIANGAVRSPDAIRAQVLAYRDIGCTELYFDPTSTSPDQVDRLADVVF